MPTVLGAAGAPRAAAALLALAALIGGPDEAAAIPQPSGTCPGRMLAAEPEALYGDRMTFTVLRNGAAVGSHVVRFSREGRDLVVDTAFRVDVKLLFVTAYTYGYRATDRWRDGCLVAMQATVDDDGAVSTVTAALDGDVLKVTGPAGVLSAPADIHPTHHWNAGVIGAEQVLNTITGRVAAVRMQDQGVETVTSNGQPLPARRWVYSGDLDNEVWYDSAGRWVKMRFKGKDGSVIEYRCDSCARNLSASG